MAILVAGFCCAAGCTSGNQQAVQTAATPLPETPSPPATIAEKTPVPLVPGPTQTMPAEYFVDVQVQKQGQAGIPTITAIFRGGMGTSFTTQVNVTVTCSNGGVTTKYMDHPAVGDEVDIAGTAKDDRVEVTVLVSTGMSYKVYDQVLAYQSVNP